MRTSKFYFPAALAATALLLTGCTATIEQGAVTDPVEVVNEEPVVVTDPNALLGLSDLAAGDVIEDPSKYYPNSGYKKVYELPDGTGVIVEADKPLPDSVESKLRAEIIKIAKKRADDIASGLGYEADGFTKAISAFEKATGKKVLLVTKGYGDWDDGKGFRTYYMCEGIWGDATPYANASGALKHCKSYVAKQSSPELWAIIDAS